MKLLSRILLRTALQALRRWAFIRAIDDRRYDRIEARVMAPQRDGPAPRAIPALLVPGIVRRSIAERFVYRVIDLEQMDEGDRHFLSQHQLHPHFIEANKARSSLSTSPGHPADRTATPEPRDFQLDAFASGVVTAVCPFSGKLLRSHRSFLAAEGNPVYYRYESADVFFLAVGRPGIGYGKLYFYFPRLHTIILLRDRCFWHGRGEVDRLRSHMIAHWRDVMSYLRSTQAPLVCALVDNNHFAHHLWNDLSGIDKLLSSGHARHVDKLIVAAEPLGPIDRVFPQLAGVAVERHDAQTIPRQALRSNWFLVRPGDNYIFRRVIQGLRDSSIASCPQAVTAEAEALRRNHWPILWVTVRTGNRTWVSQCSEIPRIANDLLLEFPGLAMIIDGFCTTYGRPALDRDEQDRVIEEEMACVERIRERLISTIPIRTNVGRPLMESIIFAGVADCYLAHHGSLQHKIGWIGNCPGLVHSNAADLRGAYGKHRAIHAREGSVPPQYLSPDLVRPAAGASPKEDNRWEEDHSNYDFDYVVARDELARLLRTISRPRAVQRQADVQKHGV